MNQFNINYAIVLTRDTFLYVLLFALCPAVATAAEGNHDSMVQSSVMETVVLLIVGVGQIVFVRKWFSGKGTLLKQWA